jgi:CubicO group peptidase (beta-lactamase class C family)
MTRPRIARPLATAILAAIAFGSIAGAADTPLPAASPESQGFATDRLERLHERMQEFVARDEHAGITMLLARNGRVVDWQAWGLRDREARLPMEKDTIVRIYSMSKIVTTVAVMQLHEEARLRLTDPVEKYLPSLAGRQVFVGGTARRPKLTPAKSSVTIRDLLTHTSGYIYPFMFGKGALDEIYKGAGVTDAATMDELIERLAKVPLAHQPGSAFRYGLGIDVAGAIVEKVSGQPLDVYVDEHIVKPLRMVDTGYEVPASKRGRLAKIYTDEKAGGLRPLDAKDVVMTSVDASRMHWGGAGMFSTIGDYARFGQMLLNGGELDGVRVLGRKSVELMLANELTHTPKPTNQFSESDGFGYGGAVRLDLARGDRLGSVGQFGWTGAATTYFNMDPRERTLALVFTQHFPHDAHELFWTFSTMFYAALVDSPVPCTSDAGPHEDRHEGDTAQAPN